MVQRIVLVKLTEKYASDEERRRVAAHTRDVLVMLPGVEGLSVGVPADEAAEASWDLSITLTFASVAAVETYRVHPAHREYVDEYLKPRMEVIKAWNFEIG